MNALDSTMSKESTHASPRMCAGCRAEAPRDALVRFVISDESPFIAPDVASRLQGRGVSVHPTRACLKAALAAGGFAKAARKRVPFTLNELASLLASKYAQRADSLISAARRNGKVVVGTDAVLESIANRSALLVLVAGDAKGSRDDIVRSAGSHDIELLVYSNKVALGAIVDRGDVGVVSLTDASLAREISRAVARCVALSEVE
jgi:hypothetical protein